MLQKVKSLAAQVNPYVVEMRRHFHMHPESSLHEFETCKRIQKELAEMGIPFEVVNEIGVIAEIKGAQHGKTVALRADIDALEIKEETGKPYASTVEGKMHACGHDAHAAMLLGAAKVLNAVKESLCGNVRLIFQPAEELVAGAKIMIEAGCLEGVDNIFGIHVASEYPRGKVDCQVGSRMAGADMINIDVYGVSGHGSRPDRCVDAVVATAAIVMNLQTIVAREYSPLDPTVVTVGLMNAGTRGNIIANKGRLELSVRSFLPETRQGLRDSIERIAVATGEAMRARVEVEVIPGKPPTINEPVCTARAREAISELFGEDALLQREPLTGSEDFAYYVERIPGAFAMMGTAPLTGPVGGHTEFFDVNEDALQDGVALHVAYALKALGCTKI